ncbi:MAG: hypothetical protein DYG89_00460 [Caldilinea sp. CFX5]|nr:hypothetical protein [Caldilinea sp. CFX5]
MAKLSYPILRHWLPSTLFVLCAIFSYTKSPLYGADPTPTPNVSTVPKPGQLFTPTPTPAPVIVIITQEAPATPAAPGNQPGNNTEETAGAQPSNGSPNANAGTNGGSAPNTNTAAAGSAIITGVIVADQVNLRQAPNTTAPILATVTANTAVTLLGRTAAADWFYLCCGGQPPQNGWVSAPFVQVTGGDLLALPVITGGPTQDKPTMTLTVALTPTLIWQGALLQLQVRVQNTSAVTLTNLTLRQSLPAALLYQTGSSDQAGKLHLEAAAGNERQVRIDWATLPPATTATAQVTLQVEPTTPNGLLFDSRTMVESSEGATAAVALTLAMPPATLPHFRK